MTAKERIYVHVKNHEVYAAIIFGFLVGARLALAPLAPIVNNNPAAGFATDLVLGSLVVCSLIEVAASENITRRDIRNNIIDSPGWIDLRSEIIKK